MDLPRREAREPGPRLGAEQSEALSLGGLTAVPSPSVPLPGLVRHALSVAVAL